MLLQGRLNRWGKFRRRCFPPPPGVASSNSWHRGPSELPRGQSEAGPGLAGFLPARTSKLDDLEDAPKPCRTAPGHSSWNQQAKPKGQFPSQCEIPVTCRFPSRVTPQNHGPRRAHAFAAPIVSAIARRGSPSAVGAPSVVSFAVWCSISALISAPSSTTMPRSRSRS